MADVLTGAESNIGQFAKGMARQRFHTQKRTGVWKCIREGHGQDRIVYGGKGFRKGLGTLECRLRIRHLQYNESRGIAMKHRILIVEDDVVIQTQLRNLLAGNGYEAETINDFPVDMEQVRSFQPHLILLDIKLPGSDGFSVCSQIRAFSNAPIIFVTSCSTDMDELNSIMLGGDAFITKPYNTAILLAKIASLLKRAYPATEQEVLSCNGVVLHLESGTIEYAGRQTDLTKNELKILYYLFKHAGIICTRADLVEYLWDNQLYVDDNALSVNINRIRDKLSAIGVTDFIKTKHRQGYIL